MDAKRNSVQNLGEYEVYLLLQKAKLLQYFDAFINHGGDDIQQLTELLKDPNEFDQLMKLVGMDRKPLHIQRFKKALAQHASQNNTSSTVEQINIREGTSNSMYSFNGSRLNNEGNTSSLTQTSWCPLIPPLYSGLNIFPTSPILNTLPTPQCVFPTNLQSVNPLLNPWTLFNNQQNYSILQALAMAITNQQLITSRQDTDGNDNKFVKLQNPCSELITSTLPKLYGYNESPEQSFQEDNNHDQNKNMLNNEELIHSSCETNQSPTQSTMNSPKTENIISPLTQTLQSLPSVIQPSPFISFMPSHSSTEMDLTMCTQISMPTTSNYSEDSFKVRPSATLMKSDYTKLETAISAFMAYLPRFSIRQPNPRNPNEQEIQKVLKLPENDPNRINGLTKHSIIFGRTDSGKRLTRPLRHFEITINEITVRLVKQIPELVTQREHLFHIARQIVNIMNYGLSVNQTGQVTWKLLDKEGLEKFNVDFKLSSSGDEFTFEANETDYSSQTLYQLLLRLKMEMQNVVNKEEILRMKIRFPGKDSVSVGNMNSLRRDLENLVNQLHTCITVTAKYIILMRSTPNHELETNESRVFPTNEHDNVDQNNHAILRK
ncbi:unnamed protein product [Trichobilharzia szidati]|nr:unnamed protein product [Trichobilharzia szidati]